MPHRALEFHDSTLAAVEVDAGAVILELSPGYVHQWEARDGRWIGTGWVAPVRIRITGVTTTLVAPRLPADIADGDLVVGNRVHVNMVPLPFEAAGDIVLTLHLVGGTSLNVAGTAAVVAAIAPGSVLEDLPADMGPILRSRITCPHCGADHEETMPTDTCLYFYECTACRTVIRPKPGDCCVFCSFGTVPCPPVQISGTCCADGRTDAE